MYLAAGVYLSDAPDPLPPPLHTEWLHTSFYTYSNRAGGGEGGRWTSEKVRGVLVQKRGRKYQLCWLYLQSINSRFGVFIDIWSMALPLHLQLGGRVAKF